MNMLFICNLGMHRSRTAAEFFSKTNETRARGIYRNKFTEEDLAWADMIVVMEEHQRKEIATLFPKLYLKKRILCLQIPDIYSYNQPELIALIKEKMLEIA